MKNLDDIGSLKNLDKSNVYGSVEELNKQCLHAWEATKNLVVPSSYRNVNKILMTGMGGSGLGARIIESVYSSSLRYPLARLNDYNLPKWVDKNTLIICSSFSGTTEETIENARQAQAKKTKWMAIGAGGTLIDLAKKFKVPYYKIDPKYNPSHQPRLAIGYSVVGQLVLASKTGIINFTEKEVKRIVEAMRKMTAGLKISTPRERNLAKKIAQKLYGKKVVFVASRHLVAAAHTAKNQMNENAKHFSVIFDIPELNHHLMEGLRFPSSNQKDLVFVFVKSKLYPKRIQQRFDITEDVVKKNKVETLTWQAKSLDHLSQAFEFIQLFGFVNFYLSMLNDLDPAAIPWVDYFKTKLGQPLGK
ncbi:hypothetical protein HY357_02990 [Candidatus Roizmanbacteria bacterium]|nr:hypothetical protein [Candidatus Roizmanbacteria bacterium]